MKTAEEILYCTHSKTPELWEFFNTGNISETMPIVSTKDALSAMEEYADQFRLDSSTKNDESVIAHVSGRSELLLAYHEFYLNWRKTVTDSSAKYCVEAFLSKQ